MVTCSSSPASPPTAAVKPPAMEEVRLDRAREEAGHVRLRVSWKGRFVQGEDGSWRYVGGDHFLESLPESTKYADLMFSLSEKVDGAVSVKYQMPGEELDPESLISVNDDGDIKELFGEYHHALRLPGTPIKTFRLRLFLFPAAEEPVTPEDLAFYSHSSSIDKLGREPSGSAVGGSSAPSRAGGGGGSSREIAPGLTQAFAKVAGLTQTPSSFSSELSSASGPDAGSPEDGTATPSAAETELAWEMGFLAGQEAAALAAKGEWQALVARRMQYLGHVQSDYIVSAAEAEAAHWPEDGPLGSPWDHSGSLPGSGLFGGGGGAPHTATPLGALDDIDYDPDADEAAVAAEAAAAAARRAAAVAAASAPPSRTTSRQPSPRAPTLGVAAAPLPPLPPLPATLLPQLPGSPLGPQASVVMEDVDNDVEFQSMFESKYATGAAAAGGPAIARRSPSLANGSSLPVVAPALPAGPSLMAAAAGDGPVVHAGPPSATPALPVKHGSPGGSASPGGGSTGGGGAAHSPNTLLPTHISVFGDGLSGLDLRHAAAAAASAAARHPVQLPSHISEFGGEEDGCAGEDAEQCADRDANAMSVMKAALPDDDDLLADAIDALRRAPLPPDAVQLPTSFELLGGGGGPGGVVSPRLSPRLADGGLAAGGNGGGGGGMVEAGALPVQPGELQRSPSLDELLSKVQRIDASQVNVLAKIGEGAFGEVSLAHCSTYGNVAVKWIKPTKVERHWASFWHEAELMSRLNHPNVLRFFGLVVEGPMVVGIMTEFAAAGSLAQYLRSGVGFIPLKQRAQLALHAVNGMAYLHSLKVVHFDVKPDNLLVDGDWLSERGPVVKVADFGLSKHKYNTFCSNVHDLRGTLPYMAPEMIMDHTHVTEKADVWSLGVVFWEMLTLEVPFADMPPAQLIGALGLGKLRLTIPEWCEPDWRALMESCWVEDPALRPSCRQLATHLERIRDMAR